MRGDTGGKRAGRQEGSPHELHFPSQWNYGTISVELLSACARESRSRSPNCIPSQGQCNISIIVLDIVGLLKTPSHRFIRRGQVSCYCNACTSEIPSLEAIVSYLTSSPPKWVPKTRREIVCTPSLALRQVPSTAICDRDPDCDSSQRIPVYSTPPARFHAAVFSHFLAGLALAVGRGRKGSETNIEPSV